MSESIPKPNFFIVGAPRCATVTLRTSLTTHPDIHIPQVPEPSFFNTDLATHPSLRVADEQAYLQLFANSGSARCIGEKTAWYLVSKVAAQNIASFAPDSRIIISLRNPIHMMQSLHLQRYAALDEDIADFAEALAAEPDRARGLRVPSTAKRPFGLLYRRTASYPEQVRRFIDAFGRNRVLVIAFEQLITEPKVVYEHIFKFLGVDPTFEVVLKQDNASAPLLGWKRMLHRYPGLHRLYHRIVPRSIASVARKAWHFGRPTPRSTKRLDDDLLESLKREFHPHVAELSEMLQFDFARWWNLTPKPNSHNAYGHSI